MVIFNSYFDIPRGYQQIGLFRRGGDYFVLGGSGKKAAVMGIPQKNQRNTMPYSVIKALKDTRNDFES